MCPNRVIFGSQNESNLDPQENLLMGGGPAHLLPESEVHYKHVTWPFSQELSYIPLYLHTD